MEKLLAESLTQIIFTGTLLGQGNTFRVDGYEQKKPLGCSSSLTFHVFSSHWNFSLSCSGKPFLVLGGVN